MLPVEGLLLLGSAIVVGGLLMLQRLRRKTWGEMPQSPLEAPTTTGAAPERTPPGYPGKQKEDTK